MFQNICLRTLPPHLDPDIIVEITSTVEDHNLTAGVSFTLTCNVDDTSNIMPEITFEWTHFNGIDSVTVGTNSSRLFFSSLKLSEAGEYMCQINVRSSLLSSDLIIMSMFPYIVRVIGKSR